jgi:hypothetical protein
MNRNQIANELLEGCPDEARIDHIILATAIRAGAPKATILAMPEADRWPETYFWLRENLGKITWSAKNNSSFLNGSRPASSVLAAVYAGRRYVRDELYGEGTVTIYEDEEPVRQDECSIFTGFRWNVRKDGF